MCKTKRPSLKNRQLKIVKKIIRYNQEEMVTRDARHQAQKVFENIIGGSLTNLFYDYNSTGWIYNELQNKPIFKLTRHLYKH